MQTCTNCGNNLEAANRMCPSCGWRNRHRHNTWFLPMFLVYAALPYALISACSPAKPTNEHVPGLQFIIIIPLALFFLSAVFYWIVKYLESRKK